MNEHATAVVGLLIIAAGVIGAYVALSAQVGDPSALVGVGATIGALLAGLLGIELVRRWRSGR